MHIMAAPGLVREETSRPANLEVAMRKSVLFLALAGGLAATSGSASEDPTLEGFVQDSRGLVKSFAGALKSELQAAIEAGGPTHAISVCNVRAPEIAAELSTPGEKTIGRTSHKIRNSANAPDTWEMKVLDEFRQRAMAGESLKAMEKAARFQDGSGTTFRYMKAIPVGQVCLTCHGADIDPELKAEIDRTYPDDKATDFELGELRGAFTITKTTEE
jgi:hypothetical protein